MPFTSPQPNLPTTLRLVPRFWPLLVATGALAGIGAGLLMWLLRAVQHLAWAYRQGRFLDAVAHAPPWRLVIVLAAAGLLIGVARRWLRHHAGQGHGGEVSAAIWLDDGRLDLAPTLARALLSIVGVGMGAALGREGAPKQVGGAVASLLADWGRLDVPERRLLTACGAGAGMAAVYDVPLGGALFALEVLLGTVSLPLVVPALAASAVATGVSWLLLPHEVTYAVSFAGAPSASLMLFAVVAGPVLGAGAALYVRAIAWADGRKPSGWRQIVAPVAVFGVLGAAAITFPQLLGNGRDIVEQTLQDQVPLWLLAALLLLRVAATGACLGAGAPGGLFTPTLAVGALAGGLLGHCWALAWPGGAAGSHALIGATAFLAAATQGPLSALVLMVELTRRIDPVAVPLLLGAAGATLMARALEPRSIYAARLPR